LDFSAYEKQNVYTLPVKFGNSIGMHYLSGALFGAGWVVGSLEILGSPSGLARSFTSGFIDFVSMPVQGLFKGPWGFLVGLTHGSASLVKNVTTGTVNSVTKLATSVARNLDRLTLDNEHIHYKTDASRRHRPVGLTDGLGKGLTGLGISLLSAVGGLAHHPMQAHSPFEVFTGFGKGIVGVLTKPISGAAEFVALTGQGVLQSVGYNILPHPVIKSERFSTKSSHPIAEKIVFQQLPQFIHSNMILFSCLSTYLKKNERKNCLLILLTNFLIVADLDLDQICEVIPLEKIVATVKDAEDDDNLVVLKVKEIASAENSPKKIRDEEVGF
jgi:vacuolar protein sorting-associated protein 13B